MFDKGILAFNLQRSSIKRSILIKVLAQNLHEFPGPSLFLRICYRKKFHVKNPVYQIILVTKVIVEALSIHLTALADIGYTDLRKRHLLHQFFEPEASARFVMLESATSSSLLSVMSDDQHSVPKREKPVSLPHRLLISGQYMCSPRKS